MKFKKNSGARLGGNILYIGLLVLLMFNLISLFRIYKLEKQMNFNYHWMIVKRIRAEIIEKRLDAIEKKLKTSTP